MNIQISLEDSIYKIAENYGEPSVVIMDRGLMDGAGFMEKDGW